MDRILWARRSNNFVEKFSKPRIHGLLVHKTMLLVHVYRTKKKHGLEELVGCFVLEEKSLCED